MGFGLPVVAVGEEGCSIHEEGGGVGEVFAELVEDGEAMRVDVAPVVEFAGLEPVDAGEVPEAVACAEDDHRFGDGREGEEVDFVFGDEDGFDREVEAGEVGLCEGVVVLGGVGQEGERGVEEAEADAEGFVAEAVALAEVGGAGGGCVDRFGWQGEVEEFGECAPVVFDEFGVDAGQIDLAEVDGGAGVLAEPGDEVQHVGPRFGEFEGAEGALREPREERGFTLGYLHRIEKLFEKHLSGRRRWPVGWYHGCVDKKLTL